MSAPHSRLARSTLLSKTETAGPPKRWRIQSIRVPRHRRGFVCPRNLLTVSCARKRCQPFEITGFPPDFHRKGSLYPKHRRALFERERFTLPHRMARPFGTRRSGRRSDHQRSLGGSATRETLQGTLSPNANPGTGVNCGGYRNRCRKPPRGFSRQLRDTQSLVLDLSVYTRVNVLAQGENQENHLLCTGTKVTRANAGVRG